MSKKSHHFLTLWPWPLTYDLEKLIRSGHYHYQCVYQIWEQSIPWFLSYRVNTIAGGGRLRRKTITSPDPSDTGDIIIGHLYMSSFVQYSKAIHEFKLELQSGNTKFWSKSVNFFFPCVLEIWRMTLKNNMVPLIRYFKLCASFHSNWWIQAELQSVDAQNLWSFVPLDLEIWWLTLKINKAPFICYFKLCVSFRSNRSIHTGATGLILTQMYNAVWHN